MALKVAKWQILIGVAAMMCAWVLYDQAAALGLLPYWMFLQLWSILRKDECAGYYSQYLLRSFTFVPGAEKRYLRTKHLSEVVLA